MEKKGFNSSSTDDDHNNSNCTGLTAGHVNVRDLLLLLGGCCV